MTFAFGLVGGSSAAVYIGESIAAGGAGTVSFPAGTAAGDIAIYTFVGISSGQTLSTGTQLVTNVATGSRFTNIFFKALSSGDISSPPTFDNHAGGMAVRVWRGGTTVTVKSTNTAGTGSTCVLTGFTKSAGSKLVIASLTDQDSLGNSASIDAGFTRRGSIGVGSNETAAIADNAAYVNSATVTWSSLNSSVDNNVGYLLEIT